jgi:hypothetical protein
MSDICAPPPIADQSDSSIAQATLQKASEPIGLPLLSESVSRYFLDTF